MQPTPYRTKPYRNITRNGKTYSEHRWVMQQKLGRELQPDELVHHINGDKRDNRPENLMVMSAKEHSIHHNQRHAITKTCSVCGREYEPHPTKRARSKTCSEDCRRKAQVRRGEGRGAAAKLTEEKVREIRQRHAAGEAQNALAQEFGVGHVTVWHIIHRTTWAHVV